MNKNSNKNLLDLYMSRTESTGPRQPVACPRPCWSRSINWWRIDDLLDSQPCPWWRPPQWLELISWSQCFWPRSQIWSGSSSDEETSIPVSDLPMFNSLSEFSVASSTIFWLYIAKDLLHILAQSFRICTIWTCEHASRSSITTPSVRHFFQATSLDICRCMSLTLTLTLNLTLSMSMNLTLTLTSTLNGALNMSMSILKRPRLRRFSALQEPCVF